MPYIKSIDRKILDPLIEALADQISVGGELNYAITQLCLGFLARRGLPNYRILSEVIGHLESAKLEFYRRAVAPYEDQKIAENGDVY